MHKYEKSDTRDELDSFTEMDEHVTKHFDSKKVIRVMLPFHK